MNNTILRKPTPEDSLLLGRTQEQSGSELQAGFRAELLPSPLTMALSTMRGRLLAKTMSFMVATPGAASFIAARLALLKQAMIDAIPSGVERPLLVNTAAGYSPLGIWLAEELPHADIIEIDLSEIMRKRAMRLSKAGITRPKNLKSKSADLSITPLSDVLDERQPQVLDWTGAYSPLEEVVVIADYFRSILADEGACVIYFPWHKGVEEVRAGTRFFKNQIGEMPGVIASKEQAIDVMTQAGYRRVNVLLPSEYAPTIGLTDKMVDLEVLVVAHKAFPENK